MSVAPSRLDGYRFERHVARPENAAVREVVRLAGRIEVAGVKIVNLRLPFLPGPQTGVLKDVESEEGEGAALLVAVAVDEHAFHEAHIAGPGAGDAVGIVFGVADAIGL